MKKARFISIGITIAFKSILLAMVLALASFLLIRHYLEQQLHAGVNSGSGHDLRQFEQLRGAHFSALLSLIETLSLTSSNGGGQTLATLQGSLQRNWESLVLIHGTEQISIYDDNATLLQTLGQQRVQLPGADLRAIAATGEPRDTFFCDTHCFYLVLAPLLLDDGKTVILLLAVPAFNLLEMFAVVTETRSSLARRAGNRLQPYNLHAPDSSMAELHSLAGRYERARHTDHPGLLRERGQALYLTASPITDGSSGDPIYLLWQRDITAPVTLTERSVRYALLGMIGMGLILFLAIVLFHRKITQRTYKLAETLPLLTKSDFITATYQLHRKNQHSRFYDEIDILFDISLEVTHQLQTLNKQVEQQNRRLHAMAYRDSLTHLANRQSFYEALGQQLRAQSRRETYLGLLFIDLDGFKQINDTYGHNAGDFMLISLATRVKEAIRSADTLYRLAGDEFVILATELQNPEGLQMLAGKVATAMAPAVMYKGHSLQASLSIGGVMTQDSKIHPDQLLHRADEAMYISKNSGKGRYTFLGIIPPPAADTPA